MTEPFIIDSNFFIQAHRINYPFDVVPSFWLKVKELAERGVIISIDKVWNELHQNKDELTLWCEENLPDDFFKDTSEIISNYVKVSSWANSMSNHYLPQALSEFLDADEADAWLVAYAIERKNIIVTHETSDLRTQKRVKLPDAANVFGVACQTTIDMFRMIGEKF
jgi:hypothetical protein